jgi:hypothetical protein
MTIKLELTAEQQEIVAPLLEAAQKAYEKGCPGIVVAQVFHGHMEVGFLVNEKAKQFEKQGL